ncbi:MAG: biotin-dependent carboxyltransferase family protein [Paracoccaceae bacterium]
MNGLKILSVGPGCTLQDLGRPGMIAAGLTQGGAADPLALQEGAALLAQHASCAAIEIAGIGGRFEALCDMTIALTGAEMNVHLDGTSLPWGSSHYLAKGAVLEIGAVRRGVFGYLHVAGGFQTQVQLGSRSTHRMIGLGAPLRVGQVLPVGSSTVPSGLTLPEDGRFGGGHLRIVPSLQTESFPEELIQRFLRTGFFRNPNSTRQAMRLDFDGAGFSDPDQLSVVSEIVVPGDIQIGGDGTPYILLAECQTTGGYPRIGTVIPADLPRAVQAPPAAELRFEMLDMITATEAETQARRAQAKRLRHITPLYRDPAAISDLLSYQLISGAITGQDQKEN